MRVHNLFEDPDPWLDNYCFKFITSNIYYFYNLQLQFHSSFMGTLCLISEYYSIKYQHFSNPSHILWNDYHKTLYFPGDPKLKIYLQNFQHLIQNFYLKYYNGTNINAQNYASPLKGGKGP